MNTSLITLFKRDLDRLSEEVSAYASDTVFWKIENDIKNSGGNLTIHLLGNLNHFIGATLGNTGYIRQRNKEFNDKNIPRTQIIDEISQLKTSIDTALSSLTQEDYNKTYPINVFKKEMSTEYFLIHLYGHLNYHLGQINYHRRLLEV